MIIKLKQPEQTVYVRSMGKALRILAIVSTVDEANKLCTVHTDWAVVAEYGGLIFLADRYDHGTPIHDSWRPGL